jgi:hypothetical protein
VARQAVGEVVGPGEVPAYRARVQDLGFGDGAMGGPALQATPDDLYLGQLGHNAPLTDGSRKLNAGRRPGT